MTMQAFRLAERYRAPVMILGDGMIGQMKEPVEFNPPPLNTGLPSKEGWASCGARGRPRNIVRSLFLDPEVLEKNCHELQDKYARWQDEEVRHELYNCDENPRLLVAAHGSTARICKTAIDELKQEGVEVGLFRPITVYPFPGAALAELCDRVGKVLCVEMSMGQMVEDVQAAAGRDLKVEFFGRTGGIIPSPDEVKQAMKQQLEVSA